MVFFDSDPPEVRTKGAADEEEPASFNFSCLTPKRWKKGGKDNNELSDIVDERLDKNDKVSHEDEKREATGVGAVKTRGKEVAKNGKGTKKGQEEDAIVVASPTSGSSSLEMPAEEEDVAGKSLLKLSKTKAKKTKPKPKPQTPKRALIDDIADDESEASIEVLFRYMGCTQEAYGERYQNPTISATLTMDTTGTYETGVDGEDNDLIENIETLESADNNDDANDGDTNDGDTNDDDANDVEVNDDDANDDDGADIESDDYIGNDVLSSPSGNLLMDDDDENDDDIGNDVLSSPSGNLLMDDDDENDNDKAGEEKEIANKELIPPDDQPNTSPDQPADTTPPDKQSDDTTPFDERIIEDQPSDELIDESVPIDGQANEHTPVDEQSNCKAPTGAQLDGKDGNVVGKDGNVVAVEKTAKEQTSSAKAKPAFTRLTVNTKTYGSSIIPPEEDSRSPVNARSPVHRSAAVDKVATIMSHSALSPSVRKIALALHNAPKYPTTHYTDETDGNARTVQDKHTDKEDKAEDAPVEKQGNASGTMSKVEEMDKLIKSTRAWLETQKAERKVAEKVQVAEVKVTDNIASRAMSHMDKIAAKAISPKNTTNTALPEMKKLDTSLPVVNIASKALSPKNTKKAGLPEMKIDTSLPVIKSPISTKTPSSKAKPLSPRTLDSLLSSRKTSSDDGPKRSILEQLEEIRAKQREREALSPRSP